jgi:hypothetical protein
MPSEEEIQKMMQLVKIDEDPKGALIDHIEEEATRMAEIENQVSEIQSFVEDAVAMKIDGVDGMQGEKGDKGDKGDRGEQGIQGIKGEKGDTGFNGMNGIDGEDGIDGKDGKDGESIKGDKGDMPKHEWDGAALRFERPDGLWGEWVNLQGPKGRNGEHGTTYSVFGGGGGGTSTPTRPGGADTQVQFNDSGSFGVDADFTYNKTTNTLAIAGGILSVNQIVDATWNADVIGLDYGGTGQNLNDPNADSLMGWDDTDGAVNFWALGNGLVYDTVGNSLSVDDTVFVSIVNGNANYLQILNNLSDINDTAVARSNLGLVAGGTGDIWVEKAGDTMSGDLSMNDNIDINFGGVASLRWDTTDANANVVMLNLPSGGIVDVPVLAMGVGITGIDLGVFNGETQTTLALFNAADVTEYASFSYNNTSGFGGTGGQSEMKSTGDYKFEIGGSLAGTAGYQVNPPTGSTKLMRVVFRGGSAATARFEFGEQGSTGSYYFSDAGFDQSGWGLTTLCGRQQIISDSGNWTSTRDFDVPVMTDPLFAVTSSLNWNTDHGEAVSITWQGIGRGSVTNADWVSSTFAMETDRAMSDWIFRNVNALQSASSTTNKNGNNWYRYGSNGNILHTGAANGGDIIDSPGLGDDGEAGRAGAYYVNGAIRIITTDVNTSTYAVPSNVHYLQVRRTSTGTCTITLPAISRVRDGFVLWIEDSGNNAGVNNITINTTGADTIEFAASPAVVSVSGSVWRLQANLTGTNWIIT